MKNLTQEAINSLLANGLIEEGKFVIGDKCFIVVDYNLVHYDELYAELYRRGIATSCERTTNGDYAIFKNKEEC